MLSELLPRAHRRYASLPVLGSTLEGFAAWLQSLDLLPYLVREYLWNATRLEVRLQKKGVRTLKEVTREAIRACAPPRGRSQEDQGLSSVSRRFERYLEASGRLSPVPKVPPTLSQELAAAFGDFLNDVRGLAPSTREYHMRTLRSLLEQLRYDAEPERLARLGAKQIETYVRNAGRRMTRGSLQHEVAQLRSALRFLGLRGLIASGFETQIDTPRVFRLEKLPRALPWQTVRRFHRSIDRSTLRGLRDYAVFLLMATCGLRCSEIVGLTLDDVRWRRREIHIRQPKVASRLCLPLSDEVASALIDYIRRGRREMACRELFLSCRVPGGPIGHTAVNESFRFWVRRSGLPISGGSHCLRHSYAVHLLRQGTPLKAIGDLLGHRSAESTCTYLRLAVDDLRCVALALPRARRRAKR